jgi:hypothetical protein
MLANHRQTIRERHTHFVLPGAAQEWMLTVGRQGRPIRLQE